VTEERFRKAGVKEMLRKHNSVRDEFSGKMRGKCCVNHWFKLFLRAANGFPTFMSGISMSKDSSTGEGVESLSNTECILDAGRQIRKDRTRDKWGLMDVIVCSDPSPERTRWRGRDAERERQRSTKDEGPLIRVHKTGEDMRVLLQVLQRPLALSNKG